jgi:hypothetical protein
MLGCRSLARLLASRFSRSTTSSWTRFSELAPRRPPSPPPCGSRDFLSKTKTEAALPVDLRLASKIFHGPEVEEGCGAMV